MSLGLVGRKIGMTRIFSDDGAAVPVTVLDVANNRVTQIKTEETDGYSAVQVTYGKRRPFRGRRRSACRRHSKGGRSQQFGSSRYRLGDRGDRRCYGIRRRKTSGNGTSTQNS